MAKKEERNLFYDLGPSEPEDGTYPEEEEFEFYRNAGLAPELFDRDPEFAQRYRDWLLKNPGP